MSKLLRSRRIVALVAAYVVALQALLLPLSVAAAAPFGAALCSTSAENPQPVGSHDTGCPCAAGCGAQCCAQALLGPPQIAAAANLTYVHVTAPAPAAEVSSRPMAKGPQIPRGPPAA